MHFFSVNDIIYLICMFQDECFLENNFKAVLQSIFFILVKVVYQISMYHFSTLICTKKNLYFLSSFFIPPCLQEAQQCLKYSILGPSSNIINNFYCHKTPPPPAHPPLRPSPLALLLPFPPLILPLALPPARPFESSFYKIKKLNSLHSLHSQILVRNCISTGRLNHLFRQIIFSIHGRGKLFL